MRYEILIRSRPSHNLLTSGICVMELRFGSMLREDFEVFWLKINKEIISRVKVIPLEENDALMAGDILADMRKTDQGIGIQDVLIAASAITSKCIMVTTNTRHFSRINNLIVKNWLEKI